jgi:hypothetical protein
MDRPAIITYVYEYADTPGAVELKELSPGVEASRGIRHHATVRFVGGIVTWDSVIGAWDRFC